MHWRLHSLGDTIPPFSTILQFSSEMSNNWCTGLPCLCPSWIYCTGKQHKASLFPCLFFRLSFLCSQLLCHGSYSSYVQVFCPSISMSPFLRNADCPFFKHLPSCSRSQGIHLLALIGPQFSPFYLAMFELISYCYKNFTDRCDDLGLYFCIKVITLCPPTSFHQLSISPCCRNNPILPHTPFSPVLHISSLFRHRMS